jgi:hypothetical protein
VPHYPPQYTYERFAHVRLAALPFYATGVRRLLDRFLPGWEEHLGWSLLLERRSFLYLFISANSLILLVLVRVVLAWVADDYLRVPRFRLRAKLGRATISFFRAPEMKR